MKLIDLRPLIYQIPLRQVAKCGVLFVKVMLFSS